MRQTKFSATDLNQLRLQLDQWRQSQSGHARLPADLWRSAATLAISHGVGAVARTLRRDYNKLKKQFSQASPRSGPSAAPSFVELNPHEWLPQPTAPCRIELSDPAGARMTLDLLCDPATILGLAQAFWRRP